MMAANALMPVEEYLATRIDVETGSTSVRVLDVGVFHGDPPSSRADVPLIAIEVLSATDSLGKLVDRFEELRQAGVQHLWLVDAVHRALYRFGKHGIVEVDTLEIPENQLRVTPADIFD